MASARFRDKRSDTNSLEDPPDVEPRIPAALAAPCKRSLVPVDGLSDPLFGPSLQQVQFELLLLSDRSKLRS